MIYELFDTDGFNLVGAYETEEEALSDLRKLVAANGLDYVQTISLLMTDEHEDTVKIAEGFDLARRANIPEPATLLR
jgi:hypothetical protein